MTSLPHSEQVRLVNHLRTLRQGDLISLGAVTLVGQGPAPASLGPAVGDQPLPPGEMWSLTVESDVGWYVICSQDCDIVRDTATEPCLLICPLKYVPLEAWNARRRGPYSPREFPYPSDNRLDLPEGQRAVADLRYLTSMVKDALLQADVEVLHPLTGPQRLRFAQWLGRRMTRPANDDLVEQNVLDSAAKHLRKLSKQFDAKGKGATLQSRLVGCATDWYLSGNDRLVNFHVIIDEASAKEAGFWDTNSSEYNDRDLSTAQDKMSRDLRALLPSGLGYVCQVSVETYQGTPVSEYLGWSHWMYDYPGDTIELPD